MGADAATAELLAQFRCSGFDMGASNCVLPTHALESKASAVERGREGGPPLISTTASGGKTSSRSPGDPSAAEDATGAAAVAGADEQDPECAADEETGLLHVYEKGADES